MSKDVMLFNNSYKDSDQTRQIDTLVGKPFPLRERWKMGGTGSPKLIVTSCSVKFHNLFAIDDYRNVCNIELRPQGIILRFRVKLETYAWVIPFYKLTIYKGEAHIYSVHSDGQHIKIRARSQDKSIHSFFKRVLDRKTDTQLPSIDDL